MSNKAKSSSQSRCVDLTRRTLLVGASAAGALLAGRGLAQAQAAQPAKPLKKITVGEVSRSSTNWTRIIASSKGYFADEGLSIEAIIVQGGPPAIVQQVIGGSLDIGVPNFDMVVRGVQGGAQITMIGSSMIKFPFSMLAAPSIKSAADLKGKKVSVSSPRDPTTLFLNRWLRSNGMSLSDVDVLYVAATPERFAALVSGAMSAVALTQPFDFRAMDQGFNRIADFGLTSGDYGFLNFAVAKSWLEKNPDVARGFLRAVKRASIWLHDPANKEEAITLLAADIRQDKAIVLKTYDYYFRELNPFSRDLSIPPAAGRGVLDAMVENKELQPPVPEVSKYVDLSYLSN